MTRMVRLVGLVLFLSLTATAQDVPKADVFLGYSYVRVQPGTSGAPRLNMHGGSVSLAYNVSNFLGIVADVGVYRGGFASNRGNAVSYLFGPRLSYRQSAVMTPYAQVLFGGAHVSSGAIIGFGSPTKLNAFAMTVGGGVDANLKANIGLRLVQVEYFLTKFQEFEDPRRGISGPNRQNNLRISAGVVFRLGK